MIRLNVASAFLAFLLAAGLCAGQSDSLAGAQHQFSVNANFWSRGEVRDGAMPPEGKADYAVFLSGKAAVRLDYSNPWLEARFTPNFYGVWGSSSSGALTIEEAWFGFRHKGLFARLGRQKLNYDDERIIGSDDWVMASSTHDIVNLGYEGNRHKVHLLLAFNQNDDNINGGTYYYDGGQPYKSLQTLWYHWDILPWLGTSLIGMNTGMQSLMDQEDKTLYQQLFGIFVDLHPKKFNLQASYYRQTGREEHRLPIHAWMASAESSWQATPRFGLKLGYYYLSGDAYYVPRESKLGLALKKEVLGFNPIFGSHHKFYGAMDFFYLSTYYGGNSPGLQDLYAGVSWDIIPKLNVTGTYHYLAITAELTDVKKTLGHELEFSLNWSIAKDVSLQAGYSFMKGTETMTRLKRTSDQNRLQWGWIMMVVKPEFFKLTK